MFHEVDRTALRSFVSLRDTTVQSLTLQPTVRDGHIVYEDSPLVSAFSCPCEAGESDLGSCYACLTFFFSFVLAWFFWSGEGVKCCSLS